jgi:cytochrome c oxidase cbb3-type subunit 1
MWRAFDDFGNLQYSFVETVAAMHPFYVMRALGGVVFLLGLLVMVYNIAKTIGQGKAANLAIPAVAAH